MKKIPVVYNDEQHIYNVYQYKVLRLSSSTDMGNIGNTVRKCVCVLQPYIITLRLVDFTIKMAATQYKLLGEAEQYSLIFQSLSAGFPYIYSSHTVRVCRWVI